MNFKAKCRKIDPLQTTPVSGGVCFHTFCSKMLVELEKTELKIPNGYFTGKIWGFKISFLAKVGFFFRKKKWGTNKIEYVCICHGHPWVDGHNSIPLFTNYHHPLTKLSLLIILLSLLYISSSSCFSPTISALVLASFTLNSSMRASFHL